MKSSNWQVQCIILCLGKSAAVATTLLILQGVGCVADHHRLTYSQHDHYSGCGHNSNEDEEQEWYSPAGACLNVWLWSRGIERKWQKETYWSWTDTVRYYSSLTLFLLTLHILISLSAWPRCTAHVQTVELVKLQTTNQSFWPARDPTNHPAARSFRQLVRRRDPPSNCTSNRNGSGKMWPDSN